MSATDESGRLESLAACAIMDTPRETAFDNIVFTVAQLFRAPIAMLTLVDDTRTWTKASVGRTYKEAARAETMCFTVVENRQLLIIEDATLDGRFKHLPIVTETPGIRFFAGAPLRGPGRHVIGALCAIDQYARTVSDKQTAQLVQLAGEASELLRLRIPDLDVSA